MKNPHVESRQSASHCKGAVYITSIFYNGPYIHSLRSSTARCD